MTTSRLNAIAVVICISIIAAGGAAIATGQSTPAEPPVAQTDECTGFISDFAQLSKRAWAGNRWDWWTAHPPKSNEMKRIKKLSKCSDSRKQKKKIGDIWHKQKNQFNRFWVKKLTPPGEAWLRSTRACESGTSGGYSAVSSNGIYRGAYQFDSRSWGASGGSGDPASAPPREQDYRASVWYRSAGSGAWPVCG